MAAATTAGVARRSLYAEDVCPHFSLLRAIMHQHSLATAAGGKINAARQGRAPLGNQT